MKNLLKPRKLSARNKAAFLISILSFFFLFPGIYLSMLTISTKGSLNANIPHVEKNFIGIPSVNGTEDKHIALKLLDTNRSVLNVIHDLWTNDNRFVASMILLFSILVPLIKGALLTFVFFSKQIIKREKVFNFVRAIGKWSMCDVFIVAIFLSYLSTGATKTANDKNISMMGYDVNVHVLTNMHAQLHIGFWCFLTYCLLSLIALQLYESY